MGDKARIEKWENRLPDFSKNLQIIGEIGIVHKSGINPHTDDKGFAGMLIGYADQHPKGAYRMINLETNKISVPRDITWLHINLDEYSNSKKI